MKKLQLLIFLLTIFNSLAKAQFEVGLWPNCQNPYSIFETDHLPGVLTEKTSKETRVKHVELIKYSQEKEGKLRISRYAKTTFNELGKITSFYSVDSLWKHNSHLFQDRWKVILIKTSISYLKNMAIDTFTLVSLDNYPKRHKDNYATYYSCNSDSSKEVWAELSNKQFDTELSKYAYSPTTPLNYDSIFSRIKHDTIGIAKMKFAQTDFNESDTLLGEVRHAWTTPTLIFNASGKLQRKFPYPADLDYHIEYLYNENGQLVKKEVIGFRPYNEFYYYNDQGLISSIWVEKDKRVKLSSVFIYTYKE